MAEGDTRFTYIFDVLPPHQVEEFVFNRLDLESKKNCRLVCKRWENRVSEAVDFNLKIISFNENKIVQWIQKSAKPIKKLKIRSSLNFPYPDNGFGLNGVQKLTIRDPIYREDKEMCTENLQKLLKECKGVQWLEVLYEVVPVGADVSFLENISFSNLRKLKIFCKVQDFCAELLRKTFPHLTSLEISFLFTLTKRYESMYTELYYTQQIFEFIGRHGKTLKDIDIYRSDIDVIQKRGFQVQMCDLDKDAVNTLVDQLKQTQLSTLLYSGTTSDDVYPFCYEMLKAQTQLTKIKIKVRQMELWNLLPQVLEQCSQTLTEFEFYGYKPIDVDDQFFSCSLLANCSKLEILRFDCGVRLTDIQNLPKQIKELRLFFWDDELRLTASQVEFIAREMYNLELLEYFNTDSDLITLSQFKRLIKLPRLTTMNFNTDLGALGEIRTWILQFGQGCIQIEEDDYRIITVDRLNFNYDLIVL